MIFLRTISTRIGGILRLSAALLLLLVTIAPDSFCSDARCTEESLRIEMVQENSQDVCCDREKQAEHHPHDQAGDSCAGDCLCCHMSANVYVAGAEINAPTEIPRMLTPTSGTPIRHASTLKHPPR